MERYLDITMAYTNSSRGFLQHLRKVIECSRNCFQLEGYRLSRLGLKRIDDKVSCRIVFRSVQ